MKTETIVRAMRNASSPAARLASWQAPGYAMRSPLAGNLATIQAAKYRGDTLAEKRASLITSQGPEMSAPDAEHPLLWASPKSREILDAFAGRDFLKHRGWYSDQWQDETLETYAIRLSRFPRLLFYAVKDSMSGDFRIRLDEWEEIDFSTSGYRSADCPEDAIQDAAKSLVRSYDSTTGREAEDSCEYYRKDQVEWDIEENRETMKTLRHEIRQLARELKTLCPSALASSYPAAGKAILASLRSLLADRRELMETNSKLAAEL
jgi:hypothetical protein